MADKRVKISRVNLKGPAGNITTDKRVKITQVSLHGPKDKRVKISRVKLDHAPFDKRVVVTRVKLVCPNAAIPPVFRDTASGYQPVSVYIGDGASGEKIV